MKKGILAAVATLGLAFAAVAFAQAFPEEIVYENAAVGNTTFSHATHMEKASACTDCHPEPFAMARTAKITMADMNAGKNCGTCHKPDGKAFPASECAKCHKKE